MRKTQSISIKPKDIKVLKETLRKGKHNARVITRARVLLHTHTGMSKHRVAALLSIGRSTVQQIRARYTKGGLARALYDAPRSGRPKLLATKAESYLIALACTDSPEGTAHWTLELLAEQMIHDKKVATISDVTIMHYLHNHNIKPWLEKNVVRTKA